MNTHVNINEVMKRAKIKGFRGRARSLCDKDALQDEL